MKDKIVIIIVTAIITSIVLMTMSLVILILEKEDYEKLGLDIKYYNIDYCTVYCEDIFSTYKVYKLTRSYINEELDEQLNGNEYWSKKKYYEYVMMRFDEYITGERTEIDRENLYYYYGNGGHAVLDVKNAKLYYSSYPLTEAESDDNELLDMTLKGYTYKEVYDVKGGWQGDGRRYYTYIFEEKEGKKIAEKLSQDKNWSKEKLGNEILDYFEYNEEVKLVQNGYYHYKKICRTSDENKKYNFTDEEATGYEVAVYNLDNNALYYIWESI